MATRRAESCSRPLARTTGCASGVWESAKRARTQRREPTPLASAVRETWEVEGAALDHRVLRIVKMLQRGDGIREGMRWFAQVVGLSPSRVSHLVRRDTCGTLRELQRG